MTQQQGDVHLFQTNDEGDISVVGGVVEMSGGLGACAYLSLFGGNEDDDGASGTYNWWGNLDETEPSKTYRSETQNLLQGIPATSGNLRRIEDAAKRDLAVFTDQNIASSVSVAASIPGVNRVHLSVRIEARGEEHNFNFTENWKVSS